jgi:hypothetical protein
MTALESITRGGSPRSILATDFASLGELPIRGGWGYTIDDACIIDKDDPAVDPSLPFDGFGLEYTFVEKRIQEEMILMRPEGEQFTEIHWNLESQDLVEADGRYFDHLVFEVNALRLDEFEQLKLEFEGPLGESSPDFDAQAFGAKCRAKVMRFEREFWFDITSFHDTSIGEWLKELMDEASGGMDDEGDTLDS